MRHCVWDLLKFLSKRHDLKTLIRKEFEIDVLFLATLNELDFIIPGFLENPFFGRDSWMIMILQPKKPRDFTKNSFKP